MGASTFPRHWIYDREGSVVQKAGIIDFKRWYREAHGGNTPWGDEESEAFVTASETALERELSRQMISQGVNLERRSLSMGDALVEQGEPGRDMFLLLDGVLGVEVDGAQVAEIGPGAILGEGALLGDGTRLATLRARTACRVGVIPPDVIERSAMQRRPEGGRSRLNRWRRSRLLACSRDRSRAAGCRAGRAGTDPDPRRWRPPACVRPLGRVDPATATAIGGRRHLYPARPAGGPST